MHGWRVARRKCRRALWYHAVVSLLCEHVSMLHAKKEKTPAVPGFVSQAHRLLTSIYSPILDTWYSSISILKKANPPNIVRLPHHTHRRIDLCEHPKIGANRAPIPRAFIITECSRAT